jgi:ethanolamine utilization cobalamin adenosyltransferase
MKFITEEYLRDLYRKEAFNTYKLQQGQRLTPGAAEYLSDKKIKVDNDASKANKNVSQNSQAETIKEEGNNNLNLNKKLCYKLKSMEAVFLVTSSEILKEDIISAQNIINLGRKISNIRKVVESKCTLEPVYCRECTGMNSSNFTTEIDDCFEITEFHMQLEKSNIILKMHALRCELRELQFEIINTYKNDDESLKNKIIGNVNSIINSLSQLICLAVGGKECQRKK